MTPTYGKIVVAGILLGAAMVTDLKTKKVPNKLLLGFLPIVLIASFSSGLAAYGAVFSALGAALVFTLPLYLIKAIGGGDFKLILVLSPLLDWSGLITTVVGMLVWGSLLGLFQAVLANQGRQLLTNLVAIVAFKGKSTGVVLHKVPFTVAIFFGWLTHLSLKVAEVQWL